MNKANIFMGGSWIGLSGLLLVGAAQAVDAWGLIGMPGTALLMIGSFAMLATRKADEYTLGLWNAGASVAFGTMLISFIGLSFVEGFIDGLTNRSSERSIPADTVLVLQIASFYIGLFIKRLLGDM
ncbi:hypothetical protein OIK40_01205 [Erythrobacter sp. sf7]|uniref:MotA/TolQ/ExbB proton channel domain-containing protein n=1 Tax=Erythrobacter fulvus TaxID=2987523 RepID=A0ABT5JLA8_9SPHN|nr:hypothetical protein [Erythrobacter fulvus]MDC8753254.1 hypothetical protein [Erythrobacter fulvus]